MPIFGDPTCWVPFDSAFQYEKRFYIVKTANGTIYECWPNAGAMNVFDEGECEVEIDTDEGAFVWIGDK